MGSGKDVVGLGQPRHAAWVNASLQDEVETIHLFARMSRY